MLLPVKSKKTKEIKIRISVTNTIDFKENVLVDVRNC